jgi:hypothetical protein
MIEKLLSHIQEECFSCWHHPPSFEIRLLPKEIFKPDEEEFDFVINYENAQNPTNDCFNGHEAFDIAEAFIAGARVNYPRLKLVGFSGRLPVS